MPNSPQTLTFLHRSTMVYGNARGVVDIVSYTVWRSSDGGLVVITDDPKHLRYFRTETPSDERKSQ